MGLIDQISRQNHGYGWDGELDGISELIERDSVDDGEYTQFSLCSNCSRKKSVTNEAIEERYLQMGLGF